VKTVLTATLLFLLLGLPGLLAARPEPGSPPAAADGQSAPADHGVGARFARSLQDRGLSPELAVVVIAMLPIVELRGAVPVGINLFGMPWWKAVALSVVGNMAPIFVILLLLDRAVAWLGRIRLFRRFFDWLFARTRRKSGLIEKYEFLGLVLFVGVPLPMTGAWTGSVAAVIMGMPYWRAILANFLGVLIAAAVVTTLSLLGFWGAVVAAVALGALLANAVVSGIRARRSRV